MIHLSATSIKDFISCEKKYWYRYNSLDGIVQPIEMLMGSITHWVIEKEWQDKKKAFELLNMYIKQYSIPNKNIGILENFLDNFFFSFAHLLNINDKIEEKFLVPYNNDAEVTGRFDRILKGDIILDWKTTARPPRSISDDVQFIIYHNSYRQLYNKEPNAVLYMSLSQGIPIEYKHNEILSDVLYNEIMPNMINKLKKNEFPHSGLLKYNGCNRCLYKELCYGDLNYELGNT